MDQIDYRAEIANIEKRNLTGWSLIILLHIIDLTIKVLWWT